MISDWMDSRGVYQLAEQSAREHVEAAHAALDRLPDSESRDLLRTVAEFVIDRKL